MADIVSFPILPEMIARAEAVIARAVAEGLPLPNWAAELIGSIDQPFGEHFLDIYVVEKSSVPDQVDEGTWHLIAGEIAENRLRRLENGAVPTATETMLWRREWLARRLEGDDAYVSAALAAVSFTDAETGATCLLAATISGYSFCGLTVRTLGYFSDRASILASLRRTAYLSCDGVREHPDFALQPAIRRRHARALRKGQS